MAQDNHPTLPTILVVEDEALLRLDAIDVLERQGFDTLEAANAEEALRILDTRTDVRVLFTDVQMPGPIDGMDLAALVHRRWPNVLLLVTSAGLKIDVDQIPDDGRFIAKPYQEDDLISNLTALLQKTER